MAGEGGGVGMGVEGKEGRGAKWKRDGRYREDEGGS